MQTTEELKRELVRELVRVLDELRKALEKLLHHRVALSPVEEKERRDLMQLAMENCKDEVTLKWLRENSESGAFNRLGRMFRFLKERIDEEEKSDHSEYVDIVFVSHGSIRASMIPASCLMPAVVIKDVILYSPWNCAITNSAVFGIAAGCMQPQHRTFCCGEEKACSKPSDLHQPTHLPNHWNSMKQAGTQLIPQIMVSPLKPDDICNKLKSFKKRNRIVVPYMIPGEEDLESIPFFVVTLALSLVLLSSRFRATVHLAACLSNSSETNMLDEAHLKRQYAYAIDHTCMSHPLTTTLQYSIRLFDWMTSLWPF